MELKKLEVPTSSITEVKRSPMEVFSQARDAGTAVYVFNREKIAGVMLTQEQYETLLQQLENSRISDDNHQSAQVSVTGVEEVFENMKRVLISGTVMSAKNLDERMVALGFITKKIGYGSASELMNELKETGKIIYYLRQKNNNNTVIAEIIGEPDAQSQFFDKIIIKKFHLAER